ncbi:hypothetical protein MBLNU459_g7657t1 [Dothideomycetes sp. NU459]
MLRMDTLPQSGPDGTEAGGDTIWASGYAVYEALSPKLRAFLETLEAKHSGFEQAQKALRTTGCLRRDPIETNHPVVRTHPVTGWKTLYVNPNFTKEIIGLEKQFGNAILDNLYRTVAEGYEFQVRWKWSKNAVAIWDNRSTLHTGIFDYCSGISIGSLNVSAEISNIHARNISIIGGNNIAFIKTYPGGSGYVTNITWENFRSKASLYGLNINQYWQNKNEPDTGSVALRNLMFRNFTGSVADGTQRPPLYLVANDLTYAVNVTLEKILVWTENGTSAINKISNVFGHADSVYGVNDGLEALPSNGPPTSYTSTYTVTQAPTGYVEPTYPAWAVPTTGYGTASAIPVYTPAPLWEPNGDYDKHYWGSF